VIPLNHLSCVVMMQQLVLLSPKFWGEIFTDFFTVVCGNDCLAWQDEFFMNNPIDVEENDEHALYVAFSPVSPFLVLLSLDFLCTVHAFFPKCLSNHCQAIRHSFSEIFTKFDAHSLFLCQIQRKIAYIAPSERM
jgi:hypothetical protein